MTRVFAAMRAGARGYVLKGASQQELAQPFPELNTREQEDLGLIAKGLNNAAIGQRLLLAPRQSATSLGLLLERCATVFAAWCEAKPQVSMGM